MLSVSGLRGEFGTSLTPHVVTRFASAFASYLKDQLPAPSKSSKPSKQSAKQAPQPIIALGRDGRAGSGMVADLARGALTASGFSVLDLGVTMTPTVGVLVDNAALAGGLMVTASHNPQQWCGLKPIVNHAMKLPVAKPSKSDKPKSKAPATTPRSGAPSASMAKAIIERYTADNAAFADWKSIGSDLPGEDLTMVHPMIVQAAMDDLHVLKPIRKAKFKISLDNVAGGGRPLTAEFLEALGCKVDELYPEDSHEQGLFPHTPEPTEANLTDLCKRVKKKSSDLGFAQDPDADRLAIVDHKGRYIGEEYTLVLAAMALGELGALPKGSTLCVNLSTSRMIEDVAARFGCSVHRTAVGEANVAQAMMKHLSPIGGEGNGGVIWPEITYIRDSIGAMGLVLTLLAWRGQKLADILKEIPQYAIVKRKIDLKPGMNPQDLVEKIAKRYKDHAPDRTDGAWINFKQQRAWLHVRASNTEPIVRLIAEAPTQAMAESLLDEAAK